MKFSLLEDKDWMDNNTTEPFSIKVSGKISEEFKANDEDNEIISSFIRKTEKEYLNGKGIYSIVSEDCEEDLDNLIYEEVIKFLNDFYSEITEIQIFNHDERYKK